MTERSTNILLQFEKLRKKLKETVYDQEDAIDEIVDSFISLSYKPIDHPPKAIFTFIGPSAVGKIYLGRLLSEFLPDIKSFKHFDMGQYISPDDETQLIGQLVASESNSEGELVKFINKNPKSIIIFEDIEKADNQIQLALLDLITSDAGDRGFDFSETIIIFTSTLGSSFYHSKAFLDELKDNKMRAHALMIEAISKEKKLIYDDVQNVIEPKLLAVMAQNHIILFNKLTLASMFKIGAESLLKVSHYFTKKTGIKLEYPDVDFLIQLLTLSLAPYINARRVRRKLPDILFNHITEFVKENSDIPVKVVFKLSRSVKTFIKKLDDQEEFSLLNRLKKKKETVELEWDKTVKGKNITFTLKKAQFKPLPASRNIFKGEKPAVEFSEIGFADIAGNKNIKNTLKQIVGILKKADEVKRFKIDMPKGMLIYGPEGVGKTMLAKAFAKEAEIPYIYVSGSELFDSSYISLVYNKARKSAPCIVFLDEVDTKGIIEGTYTTMPDEQVLYEMDSLSADPDVFVFTIATARRKEGVPLTMIAPNRIDMFVEVPELDKEARKFFIQKILEKPNDGKIDIERVVRYISGMSGYDLRRIGKEAALYAIRNDFEVITEDILIDQINNIKYGYKLDKKQIGDLEKDLKMTAYHEAGHAILSYVLLPHVKIEQVTIAPRLETMGFVSYSADDFALNVSKEELFNNICVAFAGRTSQMKKFKIKGMDTGAVNDLEQATSHAYVAIANLGMDEEIGYVNVDLLSQNVNKRLFQEKLEERICKWISDAKEKTEKLIDKYWDKIEKLANILIQQEIVDGDELKNIMKNQEK